MNSKAEIDTWAAQSGIGSRPARELSDEELERVVSELLTAIGACRRLQLRVDREFYTGAFIALADELMQRALMS